MAECVQQEGRGNPPSSCDDNAKEDNMRVFVAGASGAIGSRLVPQLIDRGHEVIGTFRSPGNAERVRALGAEPIALDLLDPRAVRKAVLEAGPEAIVHQATALADVRFSRNLDRSFAQTNRLRTAGTDALLAGAREAGVHRFVAQSFAPYRYARGGWSRPKTTRSTPPRPPAQKGRSLRWPTSTRRSPTLAGSRSATAASTATPTTGYLSPCANGCSRSSATAKASCRSSTSTTPAGTTRSRRCSPRPP